MTPYLPTRVEHQDRRDWLNLQALMPYLWDYRGRVLFALSCLILSKVANVGIPVVLKALVDYLSQPEVAHSTAQPVLALPVVLLLGYGLLRMASSLFNELRDALFARVRYHAMRQLSIRVLQHLHQLSLSFHLERRTGAISRDLERGTHAVSSLLNYMVFNIIPVLVEFSLIALLLVSQYALHFVVIAFATVALYVGFTLKITEWRMHYRHDMNRLDSEANNRAVDSLINYETVKYFNNEAFEVKRYNDTLQQWETAAVKSQTSMALLNFGQGAIIALGVTVIMTAAVMGVLHQQLSLGDLVLVNALLLQLFIPLNFLGIVYRQTKYSLADMDLMFKLLERPADIEDAPAALPLQVSAGTIEFDRVNFHYQPDRPILHDISLTIPAGHKVAIVGASGSGKSTLARLLFRLYDVASGAIRIDQQDIAQVTQDSLHQAIGIVPQDTVLFNDSLLYNLAYARPNATLDEIKQAAHLAHIDHFIESLPQGYDTVVGERGLKLSGGEKQRVAIARAILKRPKILIFDEATSALDSQSEQIIQQALQDLAVDHTTLVIAHRLSTIIDAQQILVMAQGRIIEQGTHQALLQQAGVYANMWRLQQEQREQVTCGN